MIEFEPATKTADKARIALVGPGGAGKTYTALALAFGFGPKVVVVDTEHGSAAKYAGVNGWQFDHFRASSFAPLSLVNILGAATAREYDALVLDSWSHYWEGRDGMLEQVDQRKNGSSSGWKEARPDERRMIEALLAFPGHLIVTMRSKVEYVIDEDERGRKTQRRIGTKPIQRDGVEHEFDIVGDLDVENTLTVTKTRMPALAHAVIRQPGEQLAKDILAWLVDGTERLSVAECRELALSCDQTEQTLMGLYREIEAQLMIGAPTTDVDGNPTILGDLIATRGRALRAAAEAAGPAAGPAAGGAK